MLRFLKFFGLLALLLSLFLLCPACDSDSTDTDGDSLDGDNETVDGDTEIADGDGPDGDSDAENEDEDTDGDVIIRDYGLTWISIPGGAFEMGCLPNDNACPGEDTPRHLVTVPAFEMTTYEVTNTQYAAFLNDRGNNTCSGYPCVDTAGSERMSESEGVWSVREEFYNHPVIFLLWGGAKAFCEAAGGRLPSEAEWEYAARAGTTTIYICGDDIACLDEVACWKNGTPCPVGQYLPNGFGLYDMTGSVSEWVEDCWHEDYTGAPTNGGVWEGGDCSRRVLRGASWRKTYDWHMRVSFRGGAYAHRSLNTIGFRCARDVSNP
jgi:formylglycine-generating enzyme required for sulfatase activity